MKKIVFAAAALIGSLAATPALAAPFISVDFESGFGAFTPTGNVVRANGATYAACCGTNPGNTNYFAAFGGGQEASGTLATTFSTIAGRTYTVAFDYGALGGGSEPLAFNIGRTSHLVTPTANNDIVFASDSFTFVGTGRPMSLQIGSAGLANVDAIVDNVSVSLSAVPEPATWALMMIGLGAVGGAMRRRAKVRTVAFA